MRKRRENILRERKKERETGRTILANWEKDRLFENENDHSLYVSVF